MFCGYGHMGAWLSRPGSAEHPRSADPRSGAFAPFQPAVCSCPCYPCPPVLPGGTGGPGARRGTGGIVDRAGFSVLVGLWNDFARLGADRAGDREQRGLPRYIRALPPTGPRERNCIDPIFLPCWLRRHGKVGQPEEGLTVLAEALAIVDNTGERNWEAELHRHKGELLLMQQGQKVGKRRNVFGKLSTLPVVSRQSRWSCGPR